jgi:hypothetical protein
MSTSHQYNHQHFNLEDTAEARTIIASFTDGQTDKETALQAGTIEGQQGGHKSPSLPQLLPTPPPLSPDPPSQLCMEPLSSSSRLASTQPHRHHCWQCTADDFAIIAAIFTTSSSTTVHKILLPIRSTAVQVL